MMDVLDMLFTYFESDKEAGAQVMLNLMPHDKTQDDFTLYIVY